MSQAAKVQALQAAFNQLKVGLVEQGINQFHYLHPLVVAVDRSVQDLTVPVAKWICQDCLFRCLRENTCDNAEAINPLHPQSCPSVCEMYVPCGNEPVPVRGEV